MKIRSSSELLLIKEVTDASKSLKAAARGIPIGGLIKSIRTQLGMSQKALSRRANVPQSTISHVEQGKKNIGLFILNKILKAISCDLVIAPLLRESIDQIRRKQARKIVRKQVHYLKGTMNLEDQEPDEEFINQLIKQEEERLLHGPSTKLWEEND